MRRILVVDDDADIAGLLSEFLTTTGWRVTLAVNGREAIEAARDAEAPFDVAIVDWTLPDINGREVIYQLRQYQPRCVLLVTTGHGSDVVSDAYVGTVVGGLLRKPFSLKNLSETLGKLLRAA